MNQLQEKQTLPRLKSKALREIRAEQSSSKLIIPRAPFHRLVAETIQDQGKPEMRMRKEAVEALQTETEDYLINMFHDVNLIAIQSKRETVFVDDVELWKTISSR